MLPRLYDVSDGAIKIDGVDVRNYRLRALRKAIGIVQQSSLVFSGTVRENLCYGSGDHLSNEQVELAARAANCSAYRSHGHC